MKANGTYEEFNEKRTTYKKEYRQKIKDATDNKEELKTKYNLKTLKELKELGKEKGLKNISKTKKNDLIEMLLKL